MNGMDEPRLPEGREPEDMPVGLGMQLAMSPEALGFFGGLSLAERSRAIAYVQCAVTGEEARERIEKLVDCFARGEMPC